MRSMSVISRAMERMMHAGAEFRNLNVPVRMTEFRLDG
jgi:hypothetical protein